LRIIGGIISASNLKYFILDGVREMSQQFRCPNCGLYINHAKESGASELGKLLLVLFLGATIILIPLIIVLMVRDNKKEKTDRNRVCNKCGFEWVAEE
jgi:predicted RNA-binding Zn-ribbon protein involved in translation (DUF1610 family)